MYNKRNNQNQKNKTKEIFERVVKNLQEIVNKGDYEKFLKFQKKLNMFKKYSFNNLILIFSQFPDATRVARQKNMA